MFILSLSYLSKEYSIYLSFFIFFYIVNKALRFHITNIITVIISN